MYDLINDLLKYNNFWRNIVMNSEWITLSSRDVLKCFSYLSTCLLIETDRLADKHTDNLIDI